MIKIDEKLFAHAVTVASAFIANGDIRCGGSTRDGSPAMDQLGDFLPTIYRVLESAKQQIETGP